MSTQPEPSQGMVGTETPASLALSQAPCPARPRDDDDATWQLVTSLIQLVIVAHRAAQHVGTS